MEDMEIIELYWQRDERAVQESDTKYGRLCRSIARRLLESMEDSDECVSDTWLRSWNAIPPQRPDKLKLFFAKITRNLSVDKLKGRLAQKRGGGETELILEELQECVASSGDAEGEYIAKELGQTINTFVRSLPEREANLFIRRYFFGERVEDLAPRYQLTPHNAAVILSRVRQKLKKRLEKEGFLV